MKAPLSQTLFLTEDGSTIPVAVANAVTIPPLVTTDPAPAFTVQPSIAGTPRVGEELTGMDGTITNGTVVSRRWLLGAVVVSTAQAYVPTAAGEVLYEVTVQGAGSTLAASASATVAAAPTFTRSPAITSDGSPQVGEVAGLDYGDGTGAITSRLLRTDNDTVALTDASAGSYKWQTTGIYRLEVTRTLNGGTAKQLSAAITVAAADATNRTAPVLNFPAGRSAGTNPVEVEFSSPDSSIDKNTDSLYYEYTNNAKSGNGSVPLSQVTQVEGSYIYVVDLDNLDDGSFTIKARFTGPTGSPSAFSNTLSDTLGAKALPAATTTYDETRKNPRVTISSDKRTMTAENSASFEQYALTTTPRDSKRFIEYIPLDLVDAANNRWNIGICPFDAANDPTGFPAGTKQVEVPMYSGSFRAQVRAGIADGTAVFTLLFVPATSGQNNGTIEVLYKGARVMDVVSHGITNARALSSILNYGSMRVNAGQDAFRYTPDASYVRWN